MVQTQNVSNIGIITTKRNSASLMRQDYTLGSSPVAGQQLQAFSPATLAGRFYIYNPSTNLYVVVPSPAATNFATGTGYLIRMPNDHPATPINSKLIILALAGIVFAVYTFKKNRKSA